MTHRHRWFLSIPMVLAVAVLLLSGCGSDKTSNPSIIDPPDQAPPMAPTGVAVQSVNDLKFTLTWDANTEPDLAGYRVYVYDPDPDRMNAYVLINPNDMTARRTMSYAAQDGTSYMFRVTAIDAGGNESAWSDLFTYTFNMPAGGGRGNFQIREPEEPTTRPDRDR